jgi:transcriptional regulator with XRE-family HTH domain
MDKSIYTREYEILLRLLRDARERSEFTQVDLAERLGQTQSYVSKIERGQRRIDVVQLRSILLVLGIRLAEFVELLEREIERKA